MYSGQTRLIPAATRKRILQHAIKTGYAGPIRKKRKFSMNRRTGGFQGVEVKYHDTDLTTIPIASSANMSGLEMDPGTPVHCVNAVPQNDTQSGRIGRRIFQKSFNIKGQIYLPELVDGTSPKQYPIFFVSVVLDKQTNGAQLNSEDVYDNVGGNAALTTSFFRNMEYTHRFQVLKSRTFRAFPASQSFDGTNIERNGYSIPFQFFIKLPNLVTNFSGTNAEIINIVDNSIHILAGCTTTDVAATMYYNTRLRYTD